MSETGPFREPTAEREENKMLKTRVSELERDARKMAPLIALAMVVMFVAGSCLGYSVYEQKIHTHTVAPVVQKKPERHDCYFVTTSRDRPEPWNHWYVWHASEDRYTYPQTVSRNGEYLKFDDWNSGVAFLKHWNMEICK